MRPAEARDTVPSRPVGATQRRPGAVSKSNALVGSAYRPVTVKSLDSLKFMSGQPIKNSRYDLGGPDERPEP